MQRAAHVMPALASLAVPALDDRLPVCGQAALDGPGKPFPSMVTYVVMHHRMLLLGCGKCSAATVETRLVVAVTATQINSRLHIQIQSKVHSRHCIREAVKTC